MSLLSAHLHETPQGKGKKPLTRFLRNRYDIPTFVLVYAVSTGLIRRQPQLSICACKEIGARDVDRHKAAAKIIRQINLQEQKGVSGMEHNISIYFKRHVKEP